MRRLWLLLAAAVFLLAWVEESAIAPKRESGTFAIEPPTPYTHYLPAAASKGTVLAVHGLDVSREVMSFISAALADGGFDVYAIDLPGHGDSTATFRTAAAENAIRNVAETLGEGIIVLGHSLGAGLLLDLAATQHFSTMVVLAPPPLALEEIRADRVLIATGAIDIPRIRGFVPIVADIGGLHVDAWILPWAAHSAALFNPVYIARIVKWLDGDVGNARTLARILWLAVMFVSAIVFGIGLLVDQHHPGASNVQNSARLVLVRYVGASGIALLLLKFWNPLGWLRLFGTDYLIGFVFLTGIFLTVPALYERGRAVVDRPYSFDRLALFKATTAAAYVIVVLGFIIASHVLHTSFSGSRWWRFPSILLASIPFFLSDEWLIRPLEPRWKSHAIALVTRALLLASVLSSVLILNRASAFLVLIAPLITLFWIGIWFAADIVRRGTGDPLGVAIFSALVQGWAFAAWFIIL